MMNEKDVRAILGRFLFVQDDVKKLLMIYQGRKARLQLALLMLQRDNVLILDEPTNHLDIDSKEMLEQALKDFEGTILFVSHDRYFINQLANKVFDLNKDGGQLYLGDYQYFIEKTEEASALKEFEAEHNKDETLDLEDTDSSTTNTYASQKQYKRELRKLSVKLSNVKNKSKNMKNKLLKLINN